MKKLLAIAAAGVVAFASAATAHYEGQDNAVDARGQQIFDARGNCVYTNWDDVTGQCGIRKELLVVYFDFNRSSIRSNERAELNELVERLKEFNHIQDVSIIGTADRVGGDSYNTRLSQKRANNVKNYLAARGVNVRGATVSALGESDPVTNCADDLSHSELVACLQEDRRVEVKLHYTRK